MPAPVTQQYPRVIVVPRPLAEFFYERLRSYYADRNDVMVIIDRRQANDRRCQRWSCGPGPLTDRRQQQRRRTGATWSPPERPSTTA